MPKNVMTFKLPEEEENLECALHGLELKWLIDEFDQWLRSKEKYTNEKPKSYQEIRDKLWEMVNESKASTVFHNR